MSSAPRRAVGWILVVSVMGAGAPADAQAPPPPPAAAPTGGPSPEEAAARAAEAKELNRQGITLLDAGDLERALEYFTRSRKVLPTTKNTTNTAVVLDRLGRWDEALELYEELLLRYAGGLDDEDREAIAPAMAALREKVGSVAVASSVGGDVFIDGRWRGRLPLTTAIRVLPGKHTLRIARSGHRDHEGTFTVAAGTTISVEATLEPLAGVGQLLVEDVDGPGAVVFVDGVELGTTPWEGSLSPGEHLVWIRRGADRGSAPTWVQVIEKQGALTRLQSRPLGPPVAIRVEPRTASFDVDGIALGPGRWEGRLTVGTHVVTASEPGYHPVARTIALTPTEGPGEVSVRLALDPDHPRWPRPTGSFLVEVAGGVMVGPTLAGDADAGCPESCAGSSPSFGFEVQARGGYRFPVGLAIELGGGYLSLRQSIERTETSTFGAENTVVTYQLDDSVHVRGPFFAGGLSHRVELGWFHVGGRGSVGVLVASSTDAVDGTARTTGRSVPVYVEDPHATEVSAAPFLVPEAFVGTALGPVDVGFAVAAWFFPALGPSVDRGDFGARYTAGVTDPTAVENAQRSDVLDDERTFGRFWVLAPTLTAATTF